MMSPVETLLDMLNLSTSDAVSIVAGAVLSPAKMIGIVYGLYKACSLSYLDPTWKEFIDAQRNGDAE